MKILDHSIIYSGENTPKYSSCAFPAICTLKNGTVIAAKDGSLLAVYINRDAAPVIRLAKSEEGKTWQDAITVFDFGRNTKEKKNAGMNDIWSEMGNFNVGHPFIHRLPDGTLMAYFYYGPSTHRTDFHAILIEE